MMFGNVQSAKEFMFLKMVLVKLLKFIALKSRPVDFNSTRRGSLRRARTGTATARPTPTTRWESGSTTGIPGELGGRGPAATGERCTDSGWCASAESGARDRAASGAGHACAAGAAADRGACGPCAAAALQPGRTSTHAAEFRRAAAGDSEHRSGPSAQSAADGQPAREPACWSAADARGGSASGASPAAAQ